MGITSKIRKKIFRIILIVAVGGLVYMAGSYYTVKTSEGLKFYSKDTFHFNTVYVNATNLSFSDLREYPDLVKSMALEGDIEHLPGGRWINDLSDFGENVNEVIKNNDSIEEIKNNLFNQSDEDKEKSEGD